MKSPAAAVEAPQGKEIACPTGEVAAGFLGFPTHGAPQHEPHGHPCTAPIQPAPVQQGRSRFMPETAIAEYVALPERESWREA